MPRRVTFDISLTEPNDDRFVYDVGVSGTPDATHTNCYVITEGKKQYIVPVSRFDPVETVQSSSRGTAIMVWSEQSNKRITAYGQVSSSIYDSTTLLATNNTVTTNIGALCNSIVETSINATPFLYLTASDNTGWVYSNTSTVTKISTSTYPGNAGRTLAGGGAPMDGYMFQMDSRGDIWNSALNTLTNWPASNVLNASGYPDNGIAAVRWKQYIMAFGKESIEFYYNAGNAQGSPLTRNANMALHIGATSADAIVEIADTIFFCASTEDGGLSIYMWNGALTRISTPVVDRFLVEYSGSQINLQIYPDVGRHFLVVHLGVSVPLGVNNNLSWVYCVEEKFWFQTDCNLGLLKYAAKSIGTTQPVYALMATSTLNFLDEVSSYVGRTLAIYASSRKFGQPVSVQFQNANIQTPPIDPGQGRFVVYERLQLLGDSLGSSSPESISVHISDNDYRSTTTQIGTFYLSTYTPTITRMGGAVTPRSFRMSITSQSTRPFRLEKLRCTVKIGDKLVSER